MKRTPKPIFVLRCGFAHDGWERCGFAHDGSDIKGRLKRLHGLKRFFFSVWNKATINGTLRRRPSTNWDFQRPTKLGTFVPNPGKWEPASPRIAMQSIVVESRSDPRVAPILDALADGCRQLGHRVLHWRGPLSGRVPYSRRLPVGDVAIIFNGLHPSYEQSLRKLYSLGITPIFVELGWHPQNGTFQIDTAGINALASWTSQPLTNKPRTPLKVRPQGDLLLLLQLDGDTQITHLSPWFVNMAQWVKHMSQFSRLPLRIRRHPLSQPSPEVMRFVELHRLHWDFTSSLNESLANCRAVACVNSSGAVEAIANKIPVLCYGESVFRHQHATYCLTNDGLRTVAITQELAEEKCTLAEESVDELIGRITSRQWTICDVPTRLPALLQIAFKQHDSQARAVSLLARIQPSERLASCVSFVRQAAGRYAGY